MIDGCSLKIRTKQKKDHGNRTRIDRIVPIYVLVSGLELVNMVIFCAYQPGNEPPTLSLLHFNAQLHHGHGHGTTVTTVLTIVHVSKFIESHAAVQIPN